MGICHCVDTCTDAPSPDVSHSRNTFFDYFFQSVTAASGPAIDIKGKNFQKFKKARAGRQTVAGRRQINCYCYSQVWQLAVSHNFFHFSGAKERSCSIRLQRVAC
jgi:hypothetical protein